MLYVKTEDIQQLTADLLSIFIIDALKVVIEHFHKKCYSDNCSAIDYDIFLFASQPLKASLCSFIREQKFSDLCESPFYKASRYSLNKLDHIFG